MSERIREAMGKLSVKDLADKVGVSRSAVYQWLAGDTKNLKHENLFDLAEKTGYSAKWLATGTGPKRDIRAVPQGARDQVDLSFLTLTISAVEEYLDQQDLTLDAEAKAKLIVLLYETCAQKGRVEEPIVARYLRLVA